MTLARLASIVHKWLAVLVGAQILFWVASGFFFTLFPIEQIRSEHLIRETAPAAINTTALAPLRDLHGPNGEAPTRLTIEQRATGQVVLAEFGDAPTALYDAATLRQLSPLSAEQAKANRQRARHAEERANAREPPDTRES